MAASSPMVLSLLLLASLTALLVLAPRLSPPQPPTGEQAPAAPGGGGGEEEEEADDLRLFRRAALESSAAGGPPKVAFLFLTNSDLTFAPLWERFFAGNEARLRVYVHADPSARLLLPPTPSFRGRAPGRPGQRLLRAAVAALRAAPLLPAPLRRALPDTHACTQQLHRGAGGRAADGVALRGARRRGGHAPGGAVRAVPHRVAVLRAGPAPRRAGGPGAPAVAQVPRALRPRDGAGLVLPRGALLPDAAGHGGPRRRGAVHADARQLDGQRRGPPAHVRSPGGLAKAHRRPPRLQPHPPPPHVRAQVRARLPRPAPRHRRHRHLQGLMAGGSIQVLLTTRQQRAGPGASQGRRRRTARHRNQWRSSPVWTPPAASCMFISSSVSV
uniref:Core-2/I-branching beta-16-N-acetylglucosaminyltransferase family protein n=1 Tax=Zea mays TaxID=4577 RepID=C0PMM3_MAIZE|nr:unknown [Zea mays]